MAVEVVRVGSEFILNNVIARAQELPQVAGLTGGGFAAVWTSQEATVAGTTAPFPTVKGRVFDLAGSPLGAEFQISRSVAAVQRDPAVAALDGGGFVVAWTDFGPGQTDDRAPSVKAQVFDAAGNPVTGEFRVNSTTFNIQEAPSVTGLAGGGFLVTWDDWSGANGDPDVGVKGQIYSASGNPVGGEFQVNATTTSVQKDSSVTALADGGFVVTWADESGLGGDASLQGVKARVFSANGTGGPEFLVNTTTQFQQRLAEVAPLTNGGFVVTWFDERGDVTSAGMKARIFAADGSAVSAEFSVNTSTTGLQLDPAVAGLPGGGFVVVWVDSDSTSPLPTRNTSEIFAQVFDATGQKVGPEFQVNTSFAGSQGRPSVSVLANGDFVVSWTDTGIPSLNLGGDGSESAIKAQLFRITGLNEAPVITSNGGGDAAAISVAENGLDVTTVTATDANSNTLTYAIAGGADADLFTIDASTGLLRFKAAPNFEAPTDAGGDNIYNVSVSASDGELTDTQALAVTVSDVAEAPPLNAGDDGFTTISSVALTFTAAELLSNDTSSTGIAGIALTSTAGGTIRFENGAYVYRAPVGFTGVDTFTYNAQGVGGAQDEATVSVTVTPDPVNPAEDNFTTIQGVRLTITPAQLTANDVGVVSIGGVRQFSAEGAVVDFENGAYVYRALQGFTGVDFFTYNGVGVGGTQVETKVFITVTPDPVNPGEDAFTTIQGVPLTITPAELTANDVGVVSIGGVRQFSAQGAVVDFENGAYVYRALQGFTGVDFFTYNAVGVGGKQVEATVRILVTPDPVNPGEDAFTTIQGVPLTITPAELTANDVGVVSIGGVRQFSAQGAVVDFENGAYVYRALQGFTGVDFFTYNAVGVGGKQVEATVRILVTPDPNGNSVDANDDTFTTIAGVPLTITPAELTANDTGVLSIGSVPLFSANAAFVSFENGAYVYRPVPGFTGTDLFTYTATGAGGAQQTASVFVNVTPDPVDPADDVFTTIAGVPLTITPAELTANDVGVVSIGSVPLFSANAAFISFENGAYVYRPVPGFTGTDLFSYKAQGIGGTQVTATVTVNVTPDPVDPADDVFTTIAGVPLTITLAELTANDVGVVSIGSVPLFSANGAFVTFENGVYVYRPLPGFTGTDLFSYKAQGIGGTQVEATVTVNVTPSTNAPPVGGADSYTTTYQKALTVLVAQGVLENDTDPNGDALRVVGLQTDVANGTLALNANGSFTYTPDLGFAGVDSFVYTLRDSAGLEATGTAQITVEAPDFNVVAGTRLAQTLRGTDGSDVLLMGNTRIATMQGGQGADVFVFSETDGNGRRETAYIRDYQVGADAIDLAGATILRTIELGNSVWLVFAGGDRDTLVIQGINDADRLTLTDAWSQGHLLT